MAPREKILILDFLLLCNQGKVPYVQNSTQSNTAISFLVILFVISKKILCHSPSHRLPVFILNGDLLNITGVKENSVSLSDSSKLHRPEMSGSMECPDIMLVHVSCFCTGGCSCEDTGRIPSPSAQLARRLPASSSSQALTGTKGPDSRRQRRPTVPVRPWTDQVQSRGG